VLSGLLDYLLCLPQPVQIFSCPTDSTDVLLHALVTFICVLSLVQANSAKAALGMDKKEEKPDTVSYFLCYRAPPYFPRCAHT